MMFLLYRNCVGTSKGYSAQCVDIYIIPYIIYKYERFTGRKIAINCAAKVRSKRVDTYTYDIVISTHCIHTRIIVIIPIYASYAHYTCTRYYIVLRYTI